MKISQKGDTAEYLDSISAVLRDHQDCCVKSVDIQTVVVIPKLNIIANKKISTALIWDLFSEYRYQRNPLKQFLTYFYTAIITISIRINLPLFEKREFLIDDQYPAILGGNNRIRLISACNKYALIHAISHDTKWSCDSVIQATKFYSNCGCIALPQILSLPCGGYLEEQIKGVAINRVTCRDIEKTNIDLEKTLSDFFDYQLQEGFKLSIDEFFECKRDYLYKKMTSENLVSIEELKYFLSLKSKLKDTIKSSDIECIWAHGDMNTGNIFISEDEKVYVIDWEYFGISHQSYDRFVYSRNLRHVKSLDEYTLILNSPEVPVLDVLEEFIFNLVNGKSDIVLDEIKLKNCRDALTARLGE